MDWTRRLIPETARATFALRYFAWSRIPMMFFVRPSISEISDERVVVRIPLRRRTRNHLGSMYFGVLAVGADCASGVLAMKMIDAQPEGISLIFKDLSAEFHQRAEGDVHFSCADGRAIADLVSRAAASDERVEMPVTVVATVPSLNLEPVASFRLTLSLKRRH